MGFVDYQVYRAEFDLLYLESGIKDANKIATDYEEYYKWYDLEVIGNIHENPELIKKELR
jgi:hypothetical protein